MTAHPRSGLTRRRVAALVAALTVVYVAGGALWLSHRGHQMRAERFDDLASIGRLKAEALAAWRAERLADAAVLMESRDVVDGALSLLGDPTSPARERLLARLGSLCEHYGYVGAQLVDAQGSVHLRILEAVGAHVEALNLLPAAAREGAPVLTGLHRSAPGAAPHLGVVAPLLAGPPAGRKVVAAVVLSCDARRFLYPFVQSWPVPSGSAETLLVERRGDEVVFLNDLRFRDDAALSLRIPLSATDVPAVQAVLGRMGSFEGVDYRGVPVLADLRPVPGSTWFLVAKVNREEVLAGLRDEALATLLAVVGLILISGLGTSFIYKAQGKAVFAGLYRAERERREALEELETTLHSIGDAVIATDAGGRVRLMNPVAESLTGWRAIEAGGRPVAEVFRVVNEETQQPLDDPVARVLREGVVVGLANHTELVARDGSKRPIADSGAPVRGDDGAIAGVVLVFRDQTAERAAQRESALLASAIRAARDEIYVFDADTLRFRFVNDGALRNLGYSLGEAKRLTPLDLKPELTPERFAALVQPLRSGESVRQVFETVHRRADGSLYPVEVHLQLLEHHGERVFLAVIQDITERKRADLALRRLNRALRTISECNQALVRATDETTMLTEICRHLVEIGGYRMAWVGEAVNDPARTVRPLVHAGAEDAYLGAAAISWADTERGRGPTGTAIRERRNVIARDLAADPSYEPWRAAALARGYASSIALPLLLDGDRCLGALSIYAADVDAFDDDEVKLLLELAADVAFGVRILRDRGARDAAEQALEVSEERLRLALSAANQGLYDLDVQTGAAIVSPEYATMLGYDPAEFQETNAAWIERLHPEDRAPVAAAYRDYIAGKVPEYRVEFRQRTKSGDWKWILSLGKVVERDGQGRPLRMLGTHTDLTERRNLEARLRQAQRMEAVGTLAGGIAHDFNNLLQALLSSTQAARLQARDPVLAASLADIQVQVQRGAGLTRQLLLFSRQAPAHRERLDLGTLVSEQASMLRRLLPETITFIVETAMAPLPVEADAGQLGQVLTNLVVNARDAMADGGRLAISAFARGPAAVLEVADTGVGITREVRDRIFDPFFTTKPPGKGTGLGLAVVWGIVKEHGGQVEVASAAGSGATFRVVLPLAGSTTETSPVAPPEPALPVGHGERVLLIEDEEGARKGLADLLAGLRYAVTSVASAEEAVALPEAAPYDLLLTDFRLPGANGIDVARTLVDRWHALKVVVMSGYAPEDISHDLFIPDAVHFLQKPFDMAALARALRTTLDDAAPPSA